MHRKYFHFRVNERRYEFGDSDGANDWVCAKIPNDGRIKKDCIPKVYYQLLFVLCRYSIRYFQRDAPGWYVHLLENRDFKVQIYCWDLSNIITALKFSPCQGCNGGVCYCDDRDACNQGSSFVPSFLPVAMFSLLFAYLQ